LSGFFSFGRFDFVAGMCQRPLLVHRQVFALSVFLAKHYHAIAYRLLAWIFLGKLVALYGVVWGFGSFLNVQ
jgi:hypothetical protein